MSYNYLGYSLKKSIVGWVATPIRYTDRPQDRCFVLRRNEKKFQAKWLCYGYEPAIGLKGLLGTGQTMREALEDAVTKWQCSGCGAYRFVRPGKHGAEEGEKHTHCEKNGHWFLLKYPDTLKESAQ